MRRARLPRQLCFQANRDGAHFAGRRPKLFQLVGTSGCGVLLTDADGVVMDLRATDGDVGVFDAWGLTPGPAASG